MINAGSVFEWYQTNAEIDYPFDSRTADGSYQLFVDAYVVHNQFREEASRLQLVTFDPSGICDLAFEDSTVLANLTSADGFNTSVFGDYTLYRWVRSTTLTNGFTDVDLAVQLVVVSAELSNYSFPLSPPQAFLQASLVNPRTSRVRRAALAFSGLPCCAQFVSDQVVLDEGNNMSLVVQAPAPPSGLGIISPSTVRQPVVITLNAVPGAGTGLVVNCSSPNSTLKLVNGQGPAANGNLSLTGQDCTWVERRVRTTAPPTNPNTNYLATVYANLLQLHQDCQACCACEDYGNAYAALLALWNRARTAAAIIEKVREEYNALVALINSIKATTETGLHIFTQGVGRPDFNLAVQMTVWNDSAKDITQPITIYGCHDTIGYTYAPHSGIVDMSGAHKLQIDPLVDNNCLTFVIPGLKSTGYAQVSYDVRYNENAEDLFGHPVNRVGRTVQVTGDAAYDLVVVTNAVRVPLTGPLVLN